MAVEDEDRVDVLYDNVVEHGAGSHDQMTEHGLGWNVRFCSRWPSEVGSLVSRESEDEGYPDVRGILLNEIAVVQSHVLELFLLAPGPQYGAKIRSNYH